MEVHVISYNNVTMNNCNIVSLQKLNTPLYMFKKTVPYLLVTFFFNTKTSPDRCILLNERNTPVT